MTELPKNNILIQACSWCSRVTAVLEFNPESRAPPKNADPDFIYFVCQTPELEDMGDIEYIGYCSVECEIEATQ